MKQMRDSIVLVFSLVLLGGVFFPAGAQEAQKKIPVTVTADKLDYDRANDVYVAEGNVKIEQQDIKIKADKIILNNKTGDALAEGNVYLQDRTDFLQAEKLQFNVNTRAGVIYNGELFIKEGNYHMKGETIERLSETKYRVRKGTFTTCDEGEWYLKAREINVDMDRYATAKGVSFNMTGLPVIYTPYLLFPVRRQSGLLIPEFGYSSSDGFLMKNEIFWAISDYKDMTLTSDYRDKLGHGTGVEYRYVNSRDSSGELYYNYFDIFSSTDRAREIGAQYGKFADSLWEFTFEHRQEFAEDLSARVDINLVSDWFYNQELEKDLEIRSRPYVDSNAFYVERWDTAALALIGQYSLDLTQENEKTIQKLPELQYNIFQERLVGPLHLGFEGSAVNFIEQEGDGLRRADFSPGLTSTFGHQGLNLTPRAGVRGTFYDQTRVYNTTNMEYELIDEPTDRLYYFVRADLNARFSRVFGKDREAGIGRIRNSLEPIISYEFVPRVDQEDIPRFDSVDFVEAKNLLTFNLISRLTARHKEKKTGRFRTYDMMVLRLAQSYDLTEARNDLSAESPITGEFYFSTPKYFTLSATTEYDPEADSSGGRRLSSSESVRIHGDVFQLDLTHQYQRLPSKIQFLTGGAGLKLGRWRLDGKIWHDLVTDETTQEEYKIKYTSQCWGLGFAYVTNPTETKFLASFELKGLGATKF